MKSQFYKKIACVFLAAFVVLTGQTNAQNVDPAAAADRLRTNLASIAALAAASPSVAKAVAAATDAIGICGSAQVSAGLSLVTPLEQALDIGGVISGGKIEALRKASTIDIETSKVLGESQTEILKICTQLATEISNATTKLAPFAAAAAAATNGVPTDVIDGANQIADQLTNIVEQKLQRIKQIQQIIKAQKQLEEQKKSRQLIQFDQILKKISERMKLALTEKIKSTILDTLQNSGAPRWITNWSTRYANKYMNAYQQKYQEARIEEVQKGNLIRQRVLNAPSYENIGQITPSVDPTVPMAYLLHGPIMKLLDTPGIPATFALETHKKATAAGNNAEEAQKQQDIASSGYESDFECITIGGAGNSNTINVPSRGGYAATFNKSSGFALNYNLLRVRGLTQIAATSGQNNFITANTKGSVVGEKVTRIDTNAPSFADTITAKDCPPGYEKKIVTPGSTYADMSKELMGIDIKQMLNNTIEEWMNSFLNNSILCKISGTKCGKTADIGTIAKQQLLGQLSKYGNSLNEDNPVKDLIQQIVSQGGSLDGVFGSSKQGQTSRDQLSQYGNSLPSGDPMKETISQIVSAGNDSGSEGGTLSDISVGGDTTQPSSKIDCSIFRGSAKIDCETASGLFESNKELQKQMIEEEMNNLDMPGRIKRANENLGTITTKLNQVLTIYEDIATCPTDNQRLAQDIIPLIKEMIEDNITTKLMLQNVQDSIDQFRASSPEQLETPMRNQAQFLESIDATMTEIENTNIPRYFASTREWLNKIVKFSTKLTIEVEGISTTIPANINVTNRCQQSPFTTDTSGSLFVQTLTQREYTLQDFFSAWGKTFTPTQLFNLPQTDAFRDLTMSVNNVTSTEFQALTLQGNQDIRIKYTTKPAGTCIAGRLIDGSLCPAQQACRNNVLNPPTCTRQPGQNCTLIDNPLSVTSGQLLLCS